MKRIVLRRAIRSVKIINFFLNSFTRKAVHRRCLILDVWERGLTKVCCLNCGVNVERSVHVYKNEKSNALNA